MTPDELIVRLAEKKVVVSKSTINRYERDGLIELPLRGGYGRGVGRWSQHSNGTVLEVATAWAMLSGNAYRMDGQRIRFSSDTIKWARVNALCELLDYLQPQSILYAMIPRSIFGEKELRRTADKEREEWEESYNQQNKEHQEDGIDYENEIRELHKQNGVEFPAFFPVALFNNTRVELTANFQELSANVYLNQFLEYFLEFFEKE